MKFFYRRPLFIYLFITGLSIALFIGSFWLLTVGVARIAVQFTDGFSAYQWASTGANIWASFLSYFVCILVYFYSRWKFSSVKTNNWFLHEFFIFICAFSPYILMGFIGPVIQALIDS